MLDKKEALARVEACEVSIIETPRLQLRHWRDDDVEAWVEMNLDPRVMEFFPTAYPRERSEAAAALMRDRLDELGYGWWVAEVRGVAPFAGVVVLQEVPFQAPFTPAYEIGWRFAPSFWGQGYATEGARGALRHAFEVLHWDEVVAFTTAVNLRSQRVMERLGMTHDSRDDFDHPKIAQGHPLCRHLLYRLRAA